jgi:peptidoglycan/LPS O-acetylase OafA/YrhL
MRRSNNFDFLRFLFASLVLVSHSWPLTLGTRARDPLEQLGPYAPSIGTASVYGFFLISGFLIAGSWERSNNLWAFLRKRIARIYPAFIAAMTIQAFVLAPLLSENTRRPTLRSQLKALFMGIATLFGYDWWNGPWRLLSGNPFPRELNGSVWTIKYEFACYLFTAVLGVLGVIRRPRLLATLATVALVVSATRLAARREGSELVGGTWSLFLAVFLTGSVVYAYRERFALSPSMVLASIVIGFASFWSPAAARWCLAPCCAVLLFSAAKAHNPTLARWGKHGDFSYGMYLWAFPIQQIIVHVHPGLRPLQLAISAWPLALIAGVTSWYAVERPFLRDARARGSDGALTRHPEPG